MTLYCLQRGQLVMYFIDPNRRPMYLFIFQAEGQKKFEEEIRPKYLTSWEQAAKDNASGGGYLVGKQVKTVSPSSILTHLGVGECVTLR